MDYIRKGIRQNTLVTKGEKSPLIKKKWKKRKEKYDILPNN